MSKVLNTLFRPRQTLASFTHYDDLYREYCPCGILQEDIMCYWVSPVEPGTVLEVGYPLRDDTIVPDGCLDFIFEINRATGDYDSYIVGPTDQPLYIRQDFIRFQTFGVRFYPGGCYPYIKVPIVEMANKVYPLKAVAGQVADNLGPRLAASASVAEMIALSDWFFAGVKQDCKPRSDSVSNLLYNIYSTAGNITINELSVGEMLSTRQVQRLSSEWLGLGPKAFCKVVRFQKALAAVDDEGMIDWASLAFGAGYFDQAHFINEFKAFCGESPGKAFSRHVHCPIFPSPKRHGRVE